MRLINTGTLELREFIADRLPRFAILSHTWGNSNDEVTYQDWNTSQRERKIGFQKISYCCFQARRDGLEWAWVDTCCIDKTNLTELSESINSMFRWYKHSTICYVYLSDVSDEGVPSERRSRFNSNMDCIGDNSPASLRTAAVSEPNSYQLRCSAKLLSGCKWFTRGWTLQELIAPPRVIFYSQNWYQIGPHNHLMELVSSKTGIAVEIINHELPLSAVSIAARMSWVAQRKTSKKEDMAYCLLGIFEVYMPLLYGEGNRAFQRLQEEIMKCHDDESLFAWGLGKKLSKMDIHMPHPVELLKPHENISDSVPLSGFFAQSPKDFANSNSISTLIDSDSLLAGYRKIGDDDDFPSPPMLMGGGLRIELTTLCDEDLDLPVEESLKGKALCRLAYQKNLVIFAVLKCSSYVGNRLAIPLIALGFDSFVRCGRPVVLDITDFTDEMEQRHIDYAKEIVRRQKILFIKPPKPSMEEPIINQYELADYWSIPFQKRRIPIHTFAGGVAKDR